MPLTVGRQVHLRFPRSFPQKMRPLLVFIAPATVVLTAPLLMVRRICRWMVGSQQRDLWTLSIIGGLQVELRRLINGFYLLHYRLFTQTKRRSCNERCEMTCSGTKCSTCKGSKCYFVRLYRICLPMAKPITLNLCMQVGQTRQTVQSSSLLRKAI